MKTPRITSLLLAILSMAAFSGQPASGAEAPPYLSSFSKPAAGDMQILFHGTTGPFRIQTKTSVDAAWVDVLGAIVTEVKENDKGTGVFTALIPGSPVPEDLGFYRIVSEGDPTSELKGWTFLLRVSTPPNGTHFVKGDVPEVTVTILDTLGQGISRADFSSLSLYMYGPQEPTLTTTPARLLGATTDRTKSIHHYVDLRTNTAVEMTGRTMLKYRMQPVDQELPGTYTVGVRAVLLADEIQQMFKFANVQIGTATLESSVVTKAQCAVCHEGTMSGKMYMHHVDVGRSPVGSWSLDYAPPTSCKLCHNNDGYAAYNDASVAGGKVPDPLVLRVHGVHRGEALKSDFNTNSTTGLFKAYTSVVFPSDERDCTKCHVDDRWKTQPTRMACGSCHDNVWFGPVPAPTGFVGHDGGKQLNDKLCAVCHDADYIIEAHKITPPAPKSTAELAISPVKPYYVAGDKPIVSIKLRNAATGALVSPTDVAEPVISTNIQPNEWNRANLFVSGPRAFSVPVLTTASALAVKTTGTAANDLRVRKSAANNDPAVSRTAEAINYQLADVAGLEPGTYTIYLEARQASTGFSTTATYNFQVGSTNIEPSITPESACLSCHEDTRIHAGSRALTMRPDACKSCHDYEHQLTGKTNWANSVWGFGVPPMSRLAHGIHYGRYVDKPTENVGGAFSEIIFPMDVRNCTKCHADPKNTSWNDKPSRLACLACHDSDAAQVHGNIMTYDPTPGDPWSGDETESCEVCHGSDTEFSARAVHSIFNPYVPPYVREPVK